MTTEGGTTSAAERVVAMSAREDGARHPGGAGELPARRYVYRGEGTGWFQWCVWYAGRGVSRLVSVVMFRLEVRGRERVPRDGGVLLVTNHQSFLDPWLVGLGPLRQVHSMARDTLYHGGILQWLMETLNAFPVKRGTGDLGAIRMAVERLDKGYVVNIFGEGTRSEDGTIGAIAPGAWLILRRTKGDVPVVPVVIDGAYAAWPRKARFPMPGLVRMAYGKAIEAKEWRGMSAEELAGRIRRELVGLQEEMGSEHAGASRRRLEEEGKGAVGGKGKRRERGG